MKQATSRDIPKPGKKKDVDPIAAMLLPSWKQRPIFREQVMRLASMDFFPSLDEGVRELLNALIRASGGEIQKATKICDDAIRNGRPNQEKESDRRKCPTPLDLEEIAAGLPFCDSAPPGCEKCEGTGRLYVTKRARDLIDGKEYDADCQADCDCDLGRSRAAYEAERKQMERTA